MKIKFTAMRKIAIYLIYLLVIIVSCEKKDDKENRVDIKLVFDKIISYPNDSVWTKFHLDFNPVNHSSVIDWSSPDYFNNDSVYSLSLKTDYTLKFVLKTSDGKELKSFEYTIIIDSILANPKYDFRNFYEGDYFFNIRHVYYSALHPIGVDTTYFVDGFVKKTGILQSSLLNINYGSSILWNNYPLKLTDYNNLLISPYNNLSHPGETNFMFDPHSYGKFLNYDSLMLTISIYGPGMIHDAIYINAHKK